MKLSICRLVSRHYTDLQEWNQLIKHSPLSDLGQVGQIRHRTVVGQIVYV